MSQEPEPYWSSLSGAAAITRKELRLLARDRRAVVMLLLMPVLVIAILGFSTGRLLGRRDENAVMRIAWVDQDGGPLAVQLRDVLQERAGVDLETTPDVRHAQRRMDDGARVAAVVIGPQFSQRAAALTLRDLLEPAGGPLAGGLAALDVMILSLPSLTVTGRVVEQMVLGEAIRLTIKALAGRDPVIRTYLQAGGESRGATAAPTTAVTAAQPARGAGYENVVYQVLVPSYVVLFAFFLINIMARALIQEKNSGTLFRLRAAPIGSAALLLGQTVPFFLVSLVQGALLFVSGRLLFGMSWGSTPAMIVPVLACTSLAATGLGLLTATLVRSDAQVSAYATLLVIGLAGISGCFMPRDWLPELMRQVSLVTPHAWALIAYDQLLVHPSPDLERVWRASAMLVAFASAFFAFAWWRFQRVTARA